jgi:hypothetical protein
MNLRAEKLLATLTLLVLAGCADTDVAPRIGIDQDILATHRADGPTVFDLGQQSAAPWRASRMP